MRELAVTVLRDVMRRRQVVMPASSGGKLKTVLQLVFLTMMLVPWASILGDGAADAILTTALVIAWAAVGVAVVSGVQYFVAAARALRAGPQARAEG